MQLETEIKDIFEQIRIIINSHQELGFDPPPIFEKASNSPKVTSAPTNTNSLKSLQNHLTNCQRCGLSKTRTNLVFGEGNPDAKLVFIGEGPGQDEDLTGKPFVGESGKLLTRIIENGIGLGRKEVYICNIVKCRPPKNRNPVKNEIDSCLPFLQEQLKIIKPDVICLLGSIAGKTLFGKDFKITAARGKWYKYMGIPLMPTYHPAFILRNPSRERQLKGQVWQDIQKVMSRLEIIPRK